ncbi:hypothetical protein V6N11_026451 [Hibiscus sabdariffa]|uniref:Uncharacterized protein n=1 Tax=Hibiscus sabdariffa TaxID=183260 RepID=A0ABR2SWM6_9ROSI
MQAKNVRLLSDDGRSITGDLDPFPVTCSGNAHDSMIVLKQESQHTKGTNWIFVLISVYNANRARDSSSIQVVWHVDHFRPPTPFAISWGNNS